jgi:hypothetical protein
MYLTLYTSSDYCQYLNFLLVVTILAGRIYNCVENFFTYQWPQNRENAGEQSLGAAVGSCLVAAQWARQDSNLRPTGYEPAALPLSYEPILWAMKGSTFHGNHICVERETGLEPATPCLEGRNSTTELLPRDRIYFTSNLTVGKQDVMLLNR